MVLTNCMLTYLLTILVICELSLTTIPRYFGSLTLSLDGLSLLCFCFCKQNRRRRLKFPGAGAQQSSRQWPLLPLMPPAFAGKPCLPVFFFFLPTTWKSSGAAMSRNSSSGYFSISSSCRCCWVSQLASAFASPQGVASWFPGVIGREAASTWVLLASPISSQPCVS